MKTSTKYSVSDAATLYKKSRATLYKDIKNGKRQKIEKQKLILASTHS